MFKNLLDTAPAAVLVSRRSDGEVLYANNAAASLVGLPLEQLIGQKTPNFYFDPSDRERVLEALRTKNKGKNYELHVKRADGSPFWIEISFEVITFEGEPAIFAGYMDITERKQTEAALRESDERYQAVVESQSELVVRFSPDERITFVNSAYARFVGKTREKLIGGSIYDYIADQDISGIREYFLKFSTEQAELVIENTNLRHDGEPRMMEWTNSAVFDDNGAIVEFQGVARDITHRKRIENTLKESENRYRQLAESTNVIPWEVHLETWRFTYVGPQAVKLLGYPIEDWYKENFWVEHIAPHDRRSAVAFCKSSTERGEDHEFEYRMITAAGKLIWLRDIVTVVKEGGTPTKLRGIMIDITERKRAEEACAQAEIRYRRLSDMSVEGIFVLESGKIVDANQAATRMFGVTNQELIGRVAIEFIVPDARELVGEKAAQDFEGRYESMGLRRDGTAFPVEINVRMANEDGRLFRVACVRDITEIRNSQAALGESEERLRRSVIEAPIPIMIHAEDGEVLMISNKWTELSGYAHADIPTIQEWTEKAYGPNKEERREFIGKLYKIDEAVEREAHVTTAKGEQRIWEFRTSRLGRLPDDRRFVISMAVDATERNTAIEAAKDSEEKYRSLVELLPDAVYVQQEGKIVFANPSAVTLYGADDPEQLIGKEAISFVHPDDRQQILERREALGKSPIIEPSYNIRRFRLDGSSFIGGTSGVSIQWKGRPAFLIVVQDNTERQAIEDQLRQAQKMEAVGQLTGGVAHDFNNLLTVVMLNAQMLERELEGRDDLFAKPNAIVMAAKRGSELTHRLLAFSRKQTLQPQSIQLVSLCAGMTDLLKRSLGETIEIKLVTGEGTWNVMADPYQVENALLNLAINASQAMPQGGKLTIRVENKRVTSAEWAQRWEGLPGEYVALMVTDTGSGMPAHVLEHVFEPFFTTKEPGQGGGLGLSMVYGFARQSGGFAAIVSEEGKGTTVTIHLPKALPDRTFTAA